MSGTLTRVLKTIADKTRSQYSRAVQSTQSSRRRILLKAWIVCFFLCIAFLYILVHLYKLQIGRHDTYAKEATKFSVAQKNTQAIRGRIYDCNGELLAGNFYNQVILCEPKRIPEKKREMALDILSRELKTSKDILHKKFDSVLNAYVEAGIRCELTYENARLIDSWKLPGAYVVLPLEAESSEEDPQLILLPRNCSEEELEATIQRISPLTNLSPKEIQKQVKKAILRPKEITIARDVDLAVAQRIREAFSNARIPGIRILDDTARCYPQGSMLANLIGYLNAKQEGISGIEELFEKELRPTPGKIIYRKNSRGVPLPQLQTSVKPARDGKDVYLTIQAAIQKFAEEELEQVVSKYTPERAYAIMMNPKTGAIMAMAQYPSFNPNDRSTFTDPAGLQNHCLTEIFEPGSIMKGIPVAYALDKKVVTLDSTFYCEKGLWTKYGNLRDTHKNETLTVRDIIMVSSNIGSAKIGLELGPKRLYNALSSFGFGQPTHVGFYPADEAPVVFSASRESKGRLRALKQWDTLSPTRFPIGQGISCTPLQMLQAYSAIANGGVMMQPYIVDKVVSPDGTVRHTVPRQKAKPLSKAGADMIIETLKTVVTKDGTGSRARIPDYEVAGKTGTGQIWQGKAYAEKYFTSSFIGFVPANNPEFVLIVTVRGVKVHGGTACAPVFKNIAIKTLKYLGVPPTPAPTVRDSKASPSTKR